MIGVALDHNRQASSRRRFSRLLARPLLNAAIDANGLPLINTGFAGSEGKIFLLFIGGIKVIHAPGHCAGPLAFYWPQHGGMLFAADACSNKPYLDYRIVYDDFAQGKRTRNDRWHWPSSRLSSQPSLGPSSPLAALLLLGYFFSLSYNRNIHLAFIQSVGYDNVLSIELEDVPGVARHNQASTPALDREVMLSRQYLTELCEEVGIRLEQ